MTERPFDHRQFKSHARPKQRGPVACQYPGCESTFKDERACMQHRYMAHNEGTPEATPTNRSGEA